MTNLTDYNIKLDNLDHISIESVGGVTLHIFLSETQRVECQLNTEMHSISVENGIISIINKDKLDEKNLKNLQNMPKTKDTSFIDVIYNLAKDVIELGHNKSELSKKNIILNLYLNSNISLSLNGDNYDIDLNDSIINNLLIDCANLDIQGKNYAISTLSIDSSNIKGKLLFNEQNHKINIEGNNAKLTIMKGNFDGAFNLDGNNIKVDSNIHYSIARSGDNLFSADLNNGKINII